MQKKAQALIISLWVLTIVTVLAVSIGHRASFGLRLARYHRDSLRSLYLAKAGVNRAIVEIENDETGLDSLGDKWADNKDVFEKIVPGSNQDEFATVSYGSFGKDGEPIVVYGAIDEESKININYASVELLSALLEEYGVTDVPEMVNNIRAWRGDTGVTLVDYTELGYTNKAAKFSNIEEAALVKGISLESCQAIGEMITVYGSGKININTVSGKVIELLIDSCVKKLEKEEVSDREPEDLSARIIELRENKGPFASLADLQSELINNGGLTSGQSNILAKFNDEADIKSTCFYIISNGKIEGSALARAIRCVYDRSSGAKKIIYWHE